MLISLSLILLAALAGVPIFAILLMLAMQGFARNAVDWMVVPIEMYRLSELPLIETLPWFTFVGYLLSEANTSERFLNLVQAMMRWLPAALGITALCVSALFTAFTGASGVTIVALGALLYPALKTANYSEHFSLGLITSSGSLGLLLPPSVPLILYGVIAQQMNLGIPFSIHDLFVAGLVPFLIMLVLLACYAYCARPANNNPPAVPLTQAVIAAIWEIPLPLFVLLGIYGGYFTLSEVASLTIVYIMIVEMLIYREITWYQLPRVILKAMKVSGGILLVLSTSLVLSNYIIDAQIPSIIFDWVKQHVRSPVTFLLMLNIFLLVLGAFLDVFSALLVVVPLILPVAVGFGIHPVHLGIIFLINMQIGYFTPPVGMNLFIASYRFKQPLLTLYRACTPFMAVLLLVLLLITYIPYLSLWAIV